MSENEKREKYPDWQPGDFDPELTEIVRQAFPDPQELEDLLYRRHEKSPLEAKAV